MAPPRRSVLDTTVNGLTARVEDILREIDDYNERDANPLSSEEASVWLEDVENSWGICEKLYYDVRAQSTQEQLAGHPFFANGQFGAAKRQVYAARVIWRQVISADDRQPTASSTRNGNSETGEFHDYNSVGRLNRIDPPTFDGDLAQWPSFRDSFVSMVINTRLSLIDKFNYLKKSLKNNAASLIKNLPVTAENFERAWKMLNERYNNPRLLKKAQVASLLSIKAVANADDANEYDRAINQAQ